MSTLYIVSGMSEGQPYSAAFLDMSNALDCARRHDDAGDLVFWHELDAEPSETERANTEADRLKAIGADFLS